jgi:hypothetical protein
MDYPKIDSPEGKVLTRYIFEGVDAVIGILRSMWGDPKQKEIITEDKIRGFGGQIASAGDADGALKIYKLNREFFPDSFQSGVDLARGHLEIGDLDKAKRLYLAAKSTAKKGSDDIAKLEWPLSYIGALKNPLPLSLDYLSSLAGVYETRHIRVREGRLEYFRENTDNKSYRTLIPISRDTFVLKDLIYFRIQFVFDGQGKPSKIIGQYEWGRRDESKRTQ